MAALEVDCGFEIFNLGNSETVQLRDLIELIGEKMGIDPEIDQQPEQPGDVAITHADIATSEKMLELSRSYNIQGSWKVCGVV